MKQKDIRTDEPNEQDVDDLDKDYEDNYEATRDLLGYFPPECPECGTIMKFNFTSNRFKCFSCGFSMDEDEVDYILDNDEEDEDDYNDFYDEDDEDEFDRDDDSKMPECCKACGGPWPKCKISCKIFDD